MCKIVIAMKLFLVVALLLIAAQCDTISVSSPRPHRLPKWDAFMEGLRQKKQTGSCTATYNSTSCPISDVTQFDTLGRRNSGLLADVQNQGRCGSCWAFATAHMYTDYLSISTGQKVASISPQDLTECIYPDKSGCCGGTGIDASKYIEKIGAVTNQCKPYKLDKISCKDDCPADIVYGSNYCYCPVPLKCEMCSKSSGLDYNPSTLKAAMNTFNDYTNTTVSDAEVISLLQTGPVHAALRVDFYFGSYTCGVHTDHSGNCGGHAVEIVDYGTTDTGCDFWVIKNSWGTNWGEDGYMRIKRGDLEIQQIQMVFPVPQSSVRNEKQLTEFSDDEGVDTCSAVGVSNPSQDPIVQAAAEFGLEELSRLGVIKCPNSNDFIASNLTLNTIINGTTQCVRGVLINVKVRANVHGCDDDDFVVTLVMDIFMFLDGSFSLDDYHDGDSICSACLLLLLLMAIVALFLSNTI